MLRIRSSNSTLVWRCIVRTHATGESFVSRYLVGKVDEFLVLGCGTSVWISLVIWGINSVDFGRIEQQVKMFQQFRTACVLISLSLFLLIELF